MAYNPDNIFAKILRGEIPCKKVYENQDVLAFYDIKPQAKIHILVIPKQPYQSWDDFSAHATPHQMAALMQAVGLIARQLGLNQQGYRVLANNGQNAHQEIPHFHLHLLGGHPLGPMIQKDYQPSSSR